MNKKLVQRYIRGWKEVEKVEIRELRRTPLHMKLKQLISAFKLGVALGFLKYPKKDNDIESADSNWRSLKAGY